MIYHLPIPIRRTSAPYLSMFAAVVAVFTFMLPLHVHAQWRFVPMVSAGLEYDDNANLVPSSVAEKVDGYVLEAEGAAIFRDPVREFFITPRVRVRRFDDAAAFDSDDVFVRFGFRQRFQRAQFRFRGDYRDESIRTAERSDVDFDAEEPEDVPDDDSARVLDSRNRERVRLRPQLIFELGERSSLHVEASYLDLKYDENVLDLLTDYSSIEASVNYSYALTQIDTLEFGGYYRLSEFEGGARDDQSGYALGIGYIRSLAENTRLRVRAGIDSTEDSSGSERTNPVGDISVTHRLETTRLLASYRRSISGGGGGAMSVRDAINFNAIRRLSPRIDFGAGLRAYQTRALESGAVNFDEREYAELRGLIAWRISRSFSIDFDYRFTYLGRELVDATAESNRFNLWIRYSPDRNLLNPNPIQL